MIELNKSLIDFLAQEKKLTKQVCIILHHFQFYMH